MLEHAAGRHAAHQRRDDDAGQGLDQLADARRVRTLAAVDREESLRHRDRDLRRLETADRPMRADDLVVREFGTWRSTTRRRASWSDAAVVDWWWWTQPVAFASLQNVRRQALTTLHAVDHLLPRTMPRS